MDVKYINPFITAVSNVFKAALQMEVQLGRPQRWGKGGHDHDVSGIITLSGDVVGTLIIRFPRLAAVRIAAALAKTDLGKGDGGLTQTVGDLVKMIAESAGKTLGDLQVTISPPSVVIGSAPRVKHSAASPALVIPCTTLAGSFIIEASIGETGKPQEMLVGASAP